MSEGDRYPIGVKTLNGVSLSGDEHEWLKKKSREECRTMIGQIRWMVRESMDNNSSSEAGRES